MLTRGVMSKSALEFSNNHWASTIEDETAYT